MTYDLSMEEARVLGSLIEKHLTTPDYYPLTLNALMNATNQKSNRDPVVSFDEHTIIRAIDRLRDRQLAWQVQLVDSRVPKYEHNFNKALNLTEQEVAIMTVLLLRGPQTPGELRSRSSRMYPFEDLTEIEITLNDLINRDEALVKKLTLQPGRKEARYAHLMCGEEAIPDEPAAPSVRIVESAPADHGRIEALEAEVAALKQEIADLKVQFETFKSEFE